MILTPALPRRAAESVAAVRAAGPDLLFDVIKAVHEVRPDLGLKEITGLLEGAPQPVKEGVSKADADAARAADWLRGVMVAAMAPMLEPVPVEVEVSVGRTWAG